MELALLRTYRQFGIELDVYLVLDSSAAMGMCSRRGAGKVRHLNLRFLVLQDWLRAGTITRLVNRAWHEAAFERADA